VTANHCPACGVRLDTYTLAKKTRAVIRPRTVARICDGVDDGRRHVWIVQADGTLITEEAWLEGPKRVRVGVATKPLRALLRRVEE
jgi:hypothetical protein